MLALVHILKKEVSSRQEGTMVYENYGYRITSECNVDPSDVALVEASKVQISAPEADG